MARYRHALRMRPHLGGGGVGKGRLLLALGFAVFSLLSYCSSSEYNPVTGEKQYLSLTARQEIALGLQAAPQMVAQYGGLHPDRQLQGKVDSVGRRLLRSSAAGKTEWQFDFHLLADRQTVNAFALPGGQVFITEALFSRLQSEGQLAAVLGHEIAHVVARHGAQRIAKAGLTEGLTGAMVLASGSYSGGQMAQLVGQMVNMKYGRDDELESDHLGLRFMVNAGYDPRAMIGVMKILAAASGAGQPEFFSTHPNPDNRIGRIREAIDRLFPEGIPAGLAQ